MMLDEVPSNFILNSEQQAALQALKDFIHSPDKIFLLKGYAGTGKTTLIRYIAMYLAKLKIPFFLMAPTGRAARVIKERVHYPSSTIHKHIYGYEDFKESHSEGYDTPDLLLFNFEVKSNDDGIDAVYIIDESSMVGDIKSDTGILNFGSGRLLKDIIDYADLRRDEFNRKIIFVGDPAQLPPVNMNFSPAFNAEYLRKEFGITGIREFILTEIMRQDKDSAIVKCSTEIRKHIEENYYNVLQLPADVNVISLGLDSFLEKFLQHFEHDRLDKAILVVYTNEQAYRYNKIIRHKIFGTESHIRPGDYIIVVQNNYQHQIELLNGEFGIVRAVAPEPIIKNVTYKDKDRTYNVELKFREVEIEFRTANDDPVMLSTLILENLLESPQAELWPEE